MVQSSLTLWPLIIVLVFISSLSVCGEVLMLGSLSEANHSHGKNENTESTGLWIMLSHTPSPLQSYVILLIYYSRYMIFFRSLGEDFIVWSCNALRSKGIIDFYDFKSLTLGGNKWNKRQFAILSLPMFDFSLILEIKSRSWSFIGHRILDGAMFRVLKILMKIIQLFPLGLII